MTKQECVQKAKWMLDSIIKHQPNLIAANLNSSTAGADLADFCTTFIERYADFLEKNPTVG